MWNTWKFFIYIFPFNSLKNLHVRGFRSFVPQNGYIFQFHFPQSFWSALVYHKFIQNLIFCTPQLKSAPWLWGDCFLAGVFLSVSLLLSFCLPLCFHLPLCHLSADTGMVLTFNSRHCLQKLSVAFWIRYFYSSLKCGQWKFPQLKSCLKEKESHSICWRY